MRLPVPICRLTLYSCLIVSATVGCATYDARKVSSIQEISTLCKQSSANMGPVGFRCCSLAGREAGESYLGLDPALAGMVPVLLRIQNNGNNPVKVDLANCFVCTDAREETFKTLTPSEACDRARRNDAHVIAVGIAFGPAGALISGAQAAEVNRTLEQDYHDKSFKPTLISSGFEGQGIIFFDVPKERQLSLNSLIVSTIDANTMEQREVIIDLSK